MVNEILSCTMIFYHVKSEKAHVVYIDFYNVKFVITINVIVSFHVVSFSLQEDAYTTDGCLCSLSAVLYI